MSSILQNIILGISLAAPVGPLSLAIIKTGFNKGFWSAFKVALGVVSADTTYVLLVYFGLSNFVTIPVVKTLLFFFGFIVLSYLGYLSIKEASANMELKKSDEKINKNLFYVGYAINISNLIAIVWWLGVFGSILASNQDTSRALALFNSLTIVVGILLWHTGLSLSSHYGRKLLNKKVLRIISVIGGIALLAFALKFGYNAYLSLK